RRLLPPISLPFPYTTLFRSGRVCARYGGGVDRCANAARAQIAEHGVRHLVAGLHLECRAAGTEGQFLAAAGVGVNAGDDVGVLEDRKSTRLNSSHQIISYAV